MATFRDCLVLLNPHSTSYTHALRQVGGIKDLFAPSQYGQHTLRPEDYTAPEELLLLFKKLDKDSLLVIGAGDGTINTIVNLLHDARLPSHCHEATILPLWGGNASDLAHMLNGHRHINVGHILEAGQRTTMFPLTVSIGTKESRLALSYVSVGAVARTAQTLDASPLITSKGLRRFLRFPFEMAVGLFGLTRSRRFLASIDGRTQRIYDVLCINGRRIAKIYRAPAKLQRPGFVSTVMRHKHPTLFAHPLMLVSTWIRRPLVQEFDMTVLEPTLMQFDGEVTSVPADTVISVKQSSQPIYMLATKL